MSCHRVCQNFSPALGLSKILSMTILTWLKSPIASRWSLICISSTPRLLSAPSAGTAFRPRWAMSNNSAKNFDSLMDFVRGYSHAATGYRAKLLYRATYRHNNRFDDSLDDLRAS